MTTNTNIPTGGAPAIPYASIAERMAKHVAPFATPISISTNDGASGKLLGTGSYLDVNGEKTLLTNEHNLTRRSPYNLLTHQFLGLRSIFRIVGNHLEDPWPVDAAAVAVPDRVWAAMPHQADTVPSDKVADRHAPVEDELLLFFGFAEENSLPLPGELRAPPVCCLCDPALLPSEPKVDAEFHFAMAYRRDVAIGLNGDGRLPNPPGLSGSLVWNTRYIEVTRLGGAWSPKDARVTGLLWYFVDELVIATRVEHVRAFLGEYASKEGTALRALKTPPPDSPA